MSHKHRHERNELKGCVVDLDKREIRTRDKTYRWVDRNGSRRWYWRYDDHLDEVVDAASHKKRAKDMKELLENAINIVSDYGYKHHVGRYHETYKFLLILRTSRMLDVIAREYNAVIEQIA